MSVLNHLMPGPKIGPRFQQEAAGLAYERNDMQLSLEQAQAHDRTGRPVEVRPVALGSSFDPAATSAGRP